MPKKPLQIGNRTFSKLPPANNGKHPGGAPRKYTPAFLSAIAEEMVKWFRNPKNWWLKDFATDRSIVWTHLITFADPKNENYCEEFSDALKLCHQMQESKLVKKMFQPYKDRAAQFALKNVSGWRDSRDLNFEPSSEENGYDSVSITIVRSKATNGQSVTHTSN